MFALIDLSVGIATLAVQLSLTGHILKRWGTGPGLALLAVVTAVGFAAIAMAPVLAAIIAFPLGLSVPFVWLAAVTENWTRAALTTWRFRSGKWKSMKV